MIRGRSRWSAIAAVLLAAAASVGCSSEDDDNAEPTDGGSTPAGASPTTGPIADTPTSDDIETAPAVTPAPSPPVSGPMGGNVGGGHGSQDATLLAYLFVMLEVDTADEAAWTASGRSSEAAIGDCMGDAGFQYSPMPPSVPERLTMPPEEFAARYGFGVASMALGLTGRLEDPNDDHKAAMSQSERMAFDQAYRACLDSAPPENPDALLGPGGGPAMTIATEQFRPVVNNDERVVAALADWRACMAAAGFDYEDQWAMRASFWGRIDMEDQAAMEALLAEEVLVASANVPCEEPYTDTYRRVIADRFAEFTTMYDTALATGAQPGAHG